MQDLRIMYIDDDPISLTMFKEAFSGEHKIITAKSGQEALESLKQQPDVAVVFADQYMPGLSGIDVLAKTRRDYPDVIRILLTGTKDMDTIVEAINKGHVYKYIAKPWSVSALRDIIKNALELHVLCKEKNKMLAGFKLMRNGLEQKSEKRIMELCKKIDLLKAEIAEKEKMEKALKRVYDEQILVRKEDMGLAKAKKLLQDMILRLSGFKENNVHHNNKELEELVESSLRSISSPLRTGYNPILMLLAPAEMQVANLIREGKTTKEIATLLNLSPKTIETHRRNIRKKSGITNKKIKLRTILSS